MAEFIPEAGRRSNSAALIAPPMTRMASIWAGATRGGKVASSSAKARLPTGLMVANTMAAVAAQAIQRRHRRPRRSAATSSRLGSANSQPIFETAKSTQAPGDAGRSRARAARFNPAGSAL